MFHESDSEDQCWRIDGVAVIVPMAMNGHSGRLKPSRRRINDRCAQQNLLLVSSFTVNCSWRFTELDDVVLAKDSHTATK